MRRFAELPSTSELCRALAEAGEPGGLAVVADRQTAGRGSRGRGWQSPSGGLYLSLLLRPREPVRNVGEWALLAGVAVVEAVSESARPAGRLSLKWPNDVLLDRGKLGGMLLDCAAGADGWLDWVIVGIGLNFAAAPAVAGRMTAGLDAQDGQRAALVGAILERVGHWQQMRALDGFAPVREAWLAHGPPVGGPMTLRLRDGDRAGTFAGLGCDGTLLLETGGRVQAFATGEVLLGDPPA